MQNILSTNLFQVLVLFAYFLRNASSDFKLLILGFGVIETKLEEDEL